MKHGLVVAACVVLLSGCGGNASSEPADTQPEIAWQGVPDPRPRDGVLEVDAFRGYAENVNGDFELDPAALVREYLRVDEGVVTVDGERATLLRDSLEDDSVRAERWVLDLEREGDVWAIVAARWEQRCHEGRGHATFGPELCL